MLRVKVIQSSDSGGFMVSTSTTESNEPWFKEGLGFTCTRCGHCCTGEPGFVWVNGEDVNRIAAHCGETPEFITEHYTRLTSKGMSLVEKDNGDCVFYDRSAGCTIYPVRPRQCRTWPFWESNVSSPEAWKKTCAACPGSGRGELVPADEIIERLKVIRL
jgi:hypothetical protein